MNVTEFKLKSLSLPNQVDIFNTKTQKAFWLKSNLTDSAFKKFYEYSQSALGFWNETWLVDVLEDGGTPICLRIKMQE